jgi:uncharacterized protein YejL (UPF0352 family)
MPNELLELPDITHAVPLSDADKELVQELTAVLEKHNALGRLGLTLLHQHFTIHEDELLSEEVDEKARTLTTRPVKKEELRNVHYKETAWRLDTGAPLAACQICVWDGTYGKHTTKC